MNGLNLSVLNLSRKHRSDVLHRSVSVVVLLLMVSCSVSAEQILRFGTGGNTGSYFPVGSLIAAEINKRSAVPGKTLELTVIPQRSSGSVANINDLSANLLEVGLAQADIISRAYRGMGQFKNRDFKDTLRAVGTLYQESLHLVVRSESDIDSIADLIGKRVSVDELGSGTQLDTEVLLTASGLPLEEIKLVYLKPDDSIERMRRGLLDAMFVVSGYPVDGVRQLVEDGVGRVIGLADELVDQIANQHLYLTAHSIPADIYLNDEKISTLSVSAQMIIRSDISDEVVYEVTKTLWSEEMLNSLIDGHPRGSDINADTALLGVSIPLHSGALLYYDEHGYDLQGVPR